MSLDSAAIQMDSRQRRNRYGADCRPPLDSGSRRSSCGSFARCFRMLIHLLSDLHLEFGSYETDPIALESLITRADLWLHGHTHESFDYTLGGGKGRNTRVLCNPRGYPLPRVDPPTRTGRSIRLCCWKSEPTSGMHPMRHPMKKHMSPAPPMGLDAHPPGGGPTPTVTQICRDYVWARQKPLIVSNPIAPIKPMDSPPRERALTPDEFRALWQRLNHAGATSSPIEVRAVRLFLLLGGQHWSELLGAHLADVDLTEETIDLYDVKGRRPTRRNPLPLLPRAKAEVQWLVDHSKSLGSPYLFASSDPQKPLSRDRISHFMTRTCRQMLEAQECREQFQLSDLRRTVGWALALLGVPQDIRTQLQFRQRRGMLRMIKFGGCNYFAEFRQALALLEEFLASLLAEAPADG